MKLKFFIKKLEVYILHLKYYITCILREKGKYP